MELLNLETGGFFRLIIHDTEFRNQFVRDRDQSILTIAWNKGITQQISIDGHNLECPANCLVALMINQTFEFDHPERVIAWQFNRDFYCIIDHDKEVSCGGLLFYGSADQPLVMLDDGEQAKMSLLYQVFLDELQEKDNLQEDMIRMLLTRLIIRVTRLYKQQTNLIQLPTQELDLVRQYNILVETKFKKWHQVQDYAQEMNRSPKTLSNLFAKYNAKKPLRIVHDRIILEAKRLLVYTDFTVKEIAFELGFDEVPHFNRLFKKTTSQTPTQFRNSLIKSV